MVHQPVARCGVVIPSGGRGERMGAGTPKQFRELAGTPMLLRTIRAFVQHPLVKEIVVPVPHTFMDRPPPWLADVAGAGLRLTPGGGTRAESVHRGVVALSDGCDIVVIHDAARPFVSLDTIDAVIHRAAAGDAAIAAVPVSDTLKRGDAVGRWIVDTVDRARLWRAQTPQGFPLGTLLAAYERRPAWADEGHTDEAALVEAAGFRVGLVPDSTRNIKITTPEDLEIAEAILRA
jgi:2-C-methyl-D-erythritol 4-phosphate cytidylyltransferase